MKILFVTPHLPYPLIFGDRQRTYLLIKNIKLKYPPNEITLITFNDEFCNKENINEFSKLGIELVIVKKEHIFFRFAFFLINILNYPLLVYKFYSKNIIKKIEDLVNGNNYDIIYVSTIHMTINILESKKIVKSNVIVDFVDSKSLYINRIIQSETYSIKKLIYQRELKYVKRLEQTVVKNFPALLVISRIDKNYIDQFSTSNNIHVVRIAYELPQFDEYEDNLNKNNNNSNITLFISGNFNYLPNIDAINHFFKDIYKHVLSKHPDTVFLISGPGIEKIQIPICPNIISLGFVKDSKEYMKSVINSDIVVSPVRLGSGIKTKIVEAMYFGKPIVCYEISNDGLDAKNNEELIVVKTPDEFIERLNNLISDKTLRQKLSKNAKQFIKNYFEDDPIEYTMDLFKKIIDEKKQQFYIHETKG